ncbi:MAG: single-stranded DNA-binding protein [Lachnospiraceae bacterium]|nr:single-stranded DNA-binding protein [Lachnospiraceae bacterium]
MEQITANELLAEAIIELGKLQTGEAFIVKDLFQGIRWNRFPRNERILLGTLFLNYVKTERPDIEPTGKNGANQQKYTMK